MSVSECPGEVGLWVLQVAIRAASFDCDSRALGECGAAWYVRSPPLPLPSLTLRAGGLSHLLRRGSRSLPFSGLRGCPAEAFWDLGPGKMGGGGCGPWRHRLLRTDSAARAPGERLVPSELHLSAARRRGAGRGGGHACLWGRY
ncbi:hypothetical protein HJG60_012109 [Phyllostomus discolor]|uniref:Uncharacterized protein n=1 Tax=Phyllostomus discolor TaxID=89673 RepID=A0A833ZDT7_9CHIR|nr:hypothetical protein HJG60_012109 [Phyllostomus discolor]